MKNLAEKLDYIRKTIKEYGSFSPNEIGENGIVLAYTKKTSSLIEHFYSDEVEVVEYVNEIEVDSNNIDYKSLSEDIIDQIVYLVEIYETHWIKTLKRCEW